MKDGLQVAVHNLKDLPSVDHWKQFLKYYKVASVSWKLTDGSNPFNQTNVPLLREYLDATLSAGATNGMWGYSYGHLPGPEGAKMAEMIEKYDQLSYIDLDCEGEGWQPKFGGKKQAETFLNALMVPKRIEVWLNSYRRPDYFPDFPWLAFLQNDKVTGSKPQTYWLQATSDDAGVLDIATCLEKYAGLNPKEPKPILPMLPFFKERGWEPTFEQIRQAVEFCKTFTKSYSIWKVDWVFLYDKWDWMEALTGLPKIVYDDGTTNPPPADESGYRTAQVLHKGHLAIRKGPTTKATQLGWITSPATVFVKGGLVTGTDGRTWAQIGPSLYTCYQDIDKKKTIYLKFT